MTKQLQSQLETLWKSLREGPPQDPNTHPIGKLLSDRHTFYSTRLNDGRFLKYLRNTEADRESKHAVRRDILTSFVELADGSMVCRQHFALDIDLDAWDGKLRFCSCQGKKQMCIKCFSLLCCLCMLMERAIAAALGPDLQGFWICSQRKGVHYRSLDPRLAKLSADDRKRLFQREIRRTYATLGKLPENCKIMEAAVRFSGVSRSQLAAQLGQSSWNTPDLFAHWYPILDDEVFKPTHELRCPFTFNCGRQVRPFELPKELESV